MSHSSNEIHIPSILNPSDTESFEDAEHGQKDIEPGGFVQSATDVNGNTTSEKERVDVHNEKETTPDHISPLDGSQEGRADRSASSLASLDVPMTLESATIAIPVETVSSANMDVLVSTDKEKCSDHDVGGSTSIEDCRDNIAGHKEWEIFAASVLKRNASGSIWQAPGSKWQAIIDMWLEVQRSWNSIEVSPTPYIRLIAYLFGSSRISGLLQR